ncbi:hypothetical protein [Streptomyces sp. NPDC020965]|uniref:hypothetical protein n=1 Tax=Streptomyces sp. NPDC020965 TaxID=3365105 RepID=UPI00378EA9EB
MYPRPTASPNSVLLSPSSWAARLEGRVGKAACGTTARAAASAVGPVVPVVHAVPSAVGPVVPVVHAVPSAVGPVVPAVRAVLSAVQAVARAAMSVSP